MKAKLEWIIELLRENKRMSLFKIASTTGFSPHYFRYYVLPVILEECPFIKFDRKTKEIYVEEAEKA